MERLTALPAAYKFDGPRIVDGKVSCQIRPNTKEIDGELVNLWTLLGADLHKCPENGISADTQEKFMDVWADLQYHESKDLINLINEDHGYEPLSEEEKVDLKNSIRSVIDKRIESKREEYQKGLIQACSTDDELDAVVEKLSIDVEFDTDDDGDYTDSLEDRKTEAVEAL